MFCQTNDKQFNVNGKNVDSAKHRDTDAFVYLHPFANKTTFHSTRVIVGATNANTINVVLFSVGFLFFISTLPLFFLFIDETGTVGSP